VSAENFGVIVVTSFHHAIWSGPRRFRFPGGPAIVVADDDAD
jgi:hypothetical protein